MSHRVAILEEIPALRDHLVGVLREAGYDAEGFPVDPAAVVLVGRPELILVDFSACTSAGAEVLRRLRSESVLSDTVVIAMVHRGCKTQILEAAKRGADDCLLKTSLTIEGLLARVKMHLQRSDTVVPPSSATVQRPGPEKPQSAPPALKLERSETIRRIKEAEMPTMSTAVAELMRSALSPRASVGDIASALKKEPTLAARVLRIANSAAYVSARSRIVTIEDAIRQIGISTVRNLVNSLALFDVVAAGTRGEEVLRCWLHSLAVASLMEQLAAMNEEGVPGVAYLIGLCHDLPELMLRRHFPEHHDAALRRMKECGKTRTQAMAEVFDLSWRDLVGHLLSRFELPPGITDPIRSYHASGSGTPIGRLLDLAHLCAGGAMLSVGLDEPVRPLTAEELRLTSGPGATPIDLENLRSNSVVTFSMICGGASNCTDLPVPPKSLRLLYLRDKAAPVDPLLTMLRLLVRDVEVADINGKLPGDCRPDAVIAVGNPSPETIEKLKALDEQCGSSALPSLLWLAADPAKPIVLHRQLRIGQLPITAEQLGKLLERREMALAA